MTSNQEKHMAFSILSRYLVLCDHIPRHSMTLFGARTVLDGLISGLPLRSSHRL